MRNRSRILKFSLLATATLFPGLGIAQAQQEQAEEPAAAAAVAAEEGDGGPTLSIHGFLTQAYGQTDGNQFLGLTEDGTADYRAAALQIRADVTARDAFVVQFSHERFGASRLQQLKDDVELDYIFYEHRFGTATAVKVGRVQLPFGIYNEIRDVGTLLPFYRPAHNFYADGIFGTETIDGVLLFHRFQLGGSWALEADLHAGNWEFFDINPITGAYLPQPVEDSLGAQLWLETPLPGLRLGAGVVDFTVQTNATTEEPWRTLFYSLDSQFGPVILQAEYRTGDLFDADIDGGYVRLGVGLAEKVTVNGQFDYLDVDFPLLGHFDLDDDQALGLNYAFDPTRVLKAEYHWNESSFWVENVFPAILGPKRETEYWLVSFATSF